jgi:hypothetical protein
MTMTKPTTDKDRADRQTRAALSPPSWAAMFGDTANDPPVYGVESIEPAPNSSAAKHVARVRQSEAALRAERKADVAHLRKLADKRRREREELAGISTADRIAARALRGRG